VPPTPDATRTLRLIFGLVALLYLVVPPLLYQGVGLRWGVLPRWRMFYGHGINLCTAEYFLPQSGEVLDRFEALGISDPAEAGSSVRRLVGFEAVYQQGRTICRRQDAISDLRVRTQCATQRGWLQVTTGTVNLCQAHLEEAAEGREATYPYRRPEADRP
jgi:hypothetical protein